MNPDTNKFEPLNIPAEGLVGQNTDQQLEDVKRKMGQAMQSHLVRPDGSPVPRHWTVLTVGELVEVKGATLRVAHVGESHVLLEPVKATVGGKGAP